MADEPDLVAMTIEVVANYVAHNVIAPDDVPAFIAKTHDAIKQLNAHALPAEPPAPEFAPAVSVRSSTASKEHIISLIDGKPYKMLKRHLGTHGLTPAQYRDRYKLKSDYPMVAPAYAEQRRAVAKAIGLGSRFKQTPAPAEPAVTAVVAPTEIAPAIAQKVANAPAAGRKAKASAPAAQPSTPKKAPARSAAPKPRAAAKAAVPAPVALEVAEPVPAVETPAAKTPTARGRTKPKADSVAAKPSAPKKAAAKPAAAKAPAKPRRAKAVVASPETAPDMTAS